MDKSNKVSKTFYCKLCDSNIQYNSKIKHMCSKKHIYKEKIKNGEISNEEANEKEKNKYNNKVYNKTFMDKIKDKKYHCEVCGKEYSYYAKQKHLKSNFHLMAEKIRDEIKTILFH